MWMMSVLQIQLCSESSLGIAGCSRCTTLPSSKILNSFLKNNLWNVLNRTDSLHVPSDIFVKCGCSLSSSFDSFSHLLCSIHPLWAIYLFIWNFFMLRLCWSSFLNWICQAGWYWILQFANPRLLWLLVIAVHSTSGSSGSSNLCTPVVDIWT